MARLARWLVFLLLLTFPVQAQDLWLMKAHDARRTGQSLSNGPLAIDPARSWTAEAPGGDVINIGAAVTDTGVFFGTWGLLRRPEDPDPRLWDKSDGKLFGLDLETGASLWGGPLDLDLVARCYDFEGRERTATDLVFCGLFNNYHVTFYNGTVEGQAAVDTSRNVLYVGRGDGKLFAVDPDAGEILWRYVTFNPQLPEDPDGGGEVVTAPLLGPEGTVYFGTWGEGPYETHAFYGVNPDGTLQWRYPEVSSLAHRFFASPALSPEGEVIYASTFVDDDLAAPGTLYAFRREPLRAISDAERLKWALDLEVAGRSVWTVTLAVGSDGTIYVGGFYIEGPLSIPVLIAIEDRGATPAVRWSQTYRDGAQFILGIALREINDQTQRLYVTTANQGTPLFNAKEEGMLYAVDPATGATLGSYDPSDDVPEAVGGINSPAIGADGTIYFGVRGRYGDNARDGHYFAVRYDAQNGQFTRLWHEAVEGHVEWNHPSIGPDGGLYVGSSKNGSNAAVRSMTHFEGEIPEGTTPLFYAFKGPTTPVSTEQNEQPKASAEIQAVFPNPFSASATIAWHASQPGAYRIEVIDVLGRVVRTLADATYPAGSRQLRWDGRDDTGRTLASGVYFIRLRGKEATGLRSVVLQRRAP